MNAHEYLVALKREISTLPFDEQNEALAYYSDYFADAGAEREQEVIAELGSPEQLATFIRSKIASIPAQRDFKNSSKGSQNTSKKTAPQERDNSRTLLLILLVLITLPLWGSIAAGTLGVVAAIFFGILGVSLVGLIASLALLAGAVALLLKAFFWAPLQAATVALFLGGAVFLLGLACLVAVFGVWLCSKLLPAVINFIVRICKMPFNKRRGA